MTRAIHDTPRRGSVTMRLGLISIAGLWAFYFLIITGRAALMIPGRRKQPLS